MEEKEKIRRRIWKLLEEKGVATFPKPIVGRIPNFLGSERAAELLRSSEIYSRAEVVFVSPDSPQLPVRRMVLEDGKKLIMASPRLKRGFLEIEGDPSKATLSRAMEWGKEVMPWDLKIDLMVEGSVAVDPFGGRVGKGGGFGDLEFAILLETGAIGRETPIATTVHEFQIVENVPMESHDVPVDWIFTPKRLLEVKVKRPKPKGILWELLEPSKMEEIPILSILKERREMG
ncbi:MAG: 5-formyltetrahydrofolate cyclo-ligase [Candidatus Hadarchaeales archaeon]